VHTAQAPEALVAYFKSPGPGRTHSEESWALVDRLEFLGCYSAPHLFSSNSVQ
jgi:hypothetical protein